MKELEFGNAASLHNWKQRQGLVRDKASRNDRSLGSAPRRLQALLATGITLANYRNLAHRAGINANDFVELVIERLVLIGPKGSEAAIQRHKDHGIVTCIQYINSLLK
jgi:hypothetical protein